VSDYHLTETEVARLRHHLAQARRKNREAEAAAREGATFLDRVTQILEEKSSPEKKETETGGSSPAR
jgi:hypothetical protein